MRFLSAKYEEDLEELVERSPHMQKTVARYIDVTDPEYEAWKELSLFNARWVEQSLREEEHEKGLAEGLARGHAEGLVEGTQTVAIKLLKTQMPLEEIAAVTDLTLEEVEALQIKR